MQTLGSPQGSESRPKQSGTIATNWSRPLNPWRAGLQLGLKRGGGNLVPVKEPPTYAPVRLAKKEDVWGLDSWVLKEEGIGIGPRFWAGGDGWIVDSLVRGKKELGDPDSWVLGRPQLGFRLVEFGQQLGRWTLREKEAGTWNPGSSGKPGRWASPLPDSPCPRR